MGPKKAKKTKAELEEERLAREEEERKAKAAEEKRQAEERERRRQEEARIAAELKVAREQDLQRWKEEYEDFVDDIKTKHQQLLAEEKKERDRLEWLRYKDPQDEIDATVERDMNTFLSLTREQPVSDFKEAMESVRRVERLAVSVERVWSESLASKDYVLQERALSHLHALRDLAFDKLDAATVPLLRGAEKYLNDRQEMNLEETAERISLGLWASFSDIRPIRKSVQFESLGVQVDLPKQVLQQHERYVYRVVRMSIVTHNLENYMRESGQHLTTLAHNEHHYQARLTHHHHHANVSASHHPLLGRAASTQSVRDTHGKNRERDGHLTETDSHTRTETESSAAETGEATQEEKERESGAAVPSISLSVEQRAALNAKYIVGDLVYFDILYAPAAPFNLRAKKWLIRDHSSSSTTIRKASYPSSVASRFFIKASPGVALTDDLRIAVWNEDTGEWTEDGLTDFQYSAATRVVQFYTTTTGIFALVKRRQADLPLRSWKLSPVLDKPVNRFLRLLQHQQDGDGYRIAVSTKKEKETEGEDAAVVDTQTQPEREGDPQTTSEEEKGGDVQESTSSTSTAIDLTALNAALQAPRSLTNTVDNGNEKENESDVHAEQHARLTLQSAQFEVIIDIVGAHCVLIQPEAAHCSDLLHRPLSPGELLMQLQKKGIHLVPTDYDLHFAKGNCVKRRLVEDEMWRNVASCASALEFMSAKEWNTALSDSQIGVLVRESTSYACPGESFDFECVLVERDEVSLSFHNTPDLGNAPGPDGGILYSLVVGNEYGNKKNFAHALRPNEKAHVEFSKTLENRLTPEAMMRVKRVNQRFQKTVYTLLSLIKVYSQC